MFAAGPNFRDPGGESRNSPPMGGELENSPPGSRNIAQNSPPGSQPSTILIDSPTYVSANSVSTLL